ncbi:unnamed protein product [Leptosia nina]|uniref:Uncharacterized protein n=1 Tax=Leptosia nina TaxID=320188 RepID=A0AAV1JMW7_9NEOP
MALLTVQIFLKFNRFPQKISPRKFSTSNFTTSPSQAAFNKALSYLHFYIRNGTSRSVSAAALVRPTANGTHRSVIGAAVLPPTGIRVTSAFLIFHRFLWARKNVIEYAFSCNPRKAGARLPLAVTPKLCGVS